MVLVVYGFSSMVHALQVGPRNVLYADVYRPDCKADAYSERARNMIHP